MVYEPTVSCPRSFNTVGRCVVITFPEYYFLLGGAALVAWWLMTKK